MLQFTSKEQEIGNVKLSEKYYQLDPKNISEWLEKAGANEDEDITVMVSQHHYEMLLLCVLAYKSEPYQNKLSVLLLAV